MQNQTGTLKAYDVFIVVERGRDKHDKALLHIAQAPDGPAVSGWIHKSDLDGLLIKAMAEGETSPRPPAEGEGDLGTIPERGDGEKHGKKHDKHRKKHDKHGKKGDTPTKAELKKQHADEEHQKKRMKNKGGLAPSIDVKQEAAAEHNVEMLRERKAKEAEEKAQKDQAAATIAKFAQTTHRGNIDREALGVKETSPKAQTKEELHKMEKAKLILFVVANCVTGLFGLLCAYSVYTMRLSDEVAAAGGANTSAKLMFIIVFGLFFCSACGVYGAVYVKLSVLRFYAFFLMVLICAQLSTLMCLMLEVSEGAAAQSETSASAQLKLDTATSLQEQYCHIKARVEAAAEFFGVENATDANNAVTCSGQRVLDDNDQVAFPLAWAKVCTAGVNDAACGPGWFTGTEGSLSTCSQCGYDEGCDGRLTNGPIPGCAHIFSVARFIEKCKKKYMYNFPDSCKLLC